MIRDTPYVDVESKNLRTVILDMLSKEKALSAKEIFERISLSNKTYTYPAVYKTLKMLTRERKLLKHNRKLSISNEWIKELKQFIERLEKNADIIKLPSLEEFQDENSSATFFFKNYEEADKYRKDIQWQFSREKREFPYCAYYKHFKSPVSQSGKILFEIKYLKDKKLGGFLVGSSDTPIDRWCARFYMRNPGIFVKIVPTLKISDICETMILGDVIVQTYMPENLNKNIEIIYKKAKSIDSIDVLEFYEKIYKDPAKIKMVVFNNKNVAHILRSQLLGYFKKGQRGLSSKVL